MEAADEVGTDGDDAEAGAGLDTDGVLGASGELVCVVGMVPMYNLLRPARLGSLLDLGVAGVVSVTGMVGLGGVVAWIGSGVLIEGDGGRLASGEGVF